MKVNQLIEKILDKWQIKVICFLVAIFLYIFHQMSLVDTKTITVPLSVIENGLVVHTNDIQKYVTIVVRADRNEISTVHVDDFKAYINLNYETEKGIITVPVNIEPDQSILSLNPVEIKVRPETLEVQIEPKLAKFVPAEVSLAGECAEGYEIDEVSISPDFVEIYGPESIVTSVQSIQTDMINISGIKKLYSTKAGYINNNSLINVDENLQFDVKVAVKPVITEKTYTNIPVTSKNLQDNLKIITDLPAITFTVKGQELFLKDFQPSLNCAQIDLETITETGNYKVPVKIILPQALTLISKSDEDIEIEVGIVENVSEAAESENNLQEQKETLENTTETTIQ